MISEAEEAWEKLGVAPEMSGAVRRAFDEGRVTREAFAEGVETILDPHLLGEADASNRRNAELCLVYEATRRMRREMARRLERLGLEVHGDALWTQVARRCHGPVGYFTDLAPFYRSTAINLNTTSLQMKTAVNQRVFDCPAAGGFLITDAQDDLDELFDPESEVVTYHSLDELEEQVRRYRNQAEERVAIVRAAQRRIAAHHTHAHRLRMLEDFLRERFAG
jgi:spore maturation protein CgeB